MAHVSRLDDVFGALADPSRRAILARLARGEATVGDLAEPLDMALPSVSKHIRILERSGLIQRRVQGRRHWLRLRPDGLRTAGELLDFYRPFWDASVDRLADLTTELVAQSASAPATAVKAVTEDPE
jgi:DNA-binding transcriptional ArsR family regulator